MQRVNWFTVHIYKVSLIPNDNPLTLREGTRRDVLCVVYAVPVPTISWDPADITSIARTNTTSITLTGDSTYKTKTLQCIAPNNNKPPKTANTTLNV